MILSSGLGASAHAEILVVERLLPEARDTDSLAVPWDADVPRARLTRP